ncbi:AMP-binding protein, partial [bacterium]|nr:AMP-binding protein [bacterium]
MSDSEFNLFQWLHDAAEREPDPSRLVWEDTRMRWSLIEQQARRLAGGLSKIGVREGDRVAVMLPNIPPFLVAEFASLLLGSIVVPVHVNTRSEELGYLLDDSEAKVLISWSGYRDVIDDALQQTESLRHRIEIDAGEGALDFAA